MRHLIFVLQRTHSILVSGNWHQSLLYIESNLFHIHDEINRPCKSSSASLQPAINKIIREILNSNECYCKSLLKHLDFCCSLLVQPLRRRSRTGLALFYSKVMVNRKDKREWFDSNKEDIPHLNPHYVFYWCQQSMVASHVTAENQTFYYYFTTQIS